MKRGHGYHVLFGLSLLSLAVLVVWWTVLFSSSVAAENEGALAQLRHAADFVGDFAGGKNLRARLQNP